MESEIANCSKRNEHFSGHIRLAGINPNCWYMIAKSSDIKERPVRREIWNQPVVLFRTGHGELRALEDRCAHRLVRLSHGRVKDDRIECAYHGWQYNGDGRCVHIPHLASRASLPNCQIRSFSIVEKRGFVWLFPGDPELSGSLAPMEMKEWEDLNEIPSFVRLTCRAHFSYLIENLMDMYHGSLHAQYQVWTAQSLQEVMEAENQVTATYQATTYYRIKDLGSILQLFIPSLRKLHSAPLTVTYDYPNWKSTLGEDFKIYCLICPVNERLTEAYLIHYTSIAKFKSLNDVPVVFRRLLRRALSNVAKRLLANLVRQDVLMIEEEQSAFDKDPVHPPVEVNRTIRRVQQLIRRQAVNPS
ncbi:MAG: Rieske 2Fe-2S domain-containing protein [Deltaproteobacteria bacterium]|nr:Rieske 2Fe-2S domain-containing protein [Deltaproteobacteria bacterium]